MNANARSVLLGSIIGFLISGCGLLDKAPHATLRPEDTAVIHHIEDLELTLELPRDFVKQDGPAGSGVVMFCNDAMPSMRVRHCFSIQSVLSLPDEDMTSWSSEPLTGTGRFYYRTEQGSGGSSGPTQRLEGYLVLGDHIFKVRATDQEEFPREPDATWVLPIIRTARFEG